MEEDLAKIQIAEKDILKQVIEICNEHKLIYYIVGGTLLGAVRHQGFIPWDDDIDISMPRPDYEKFLVIAAQELIYPYQLNTINSMHNGFCYYYARAENKTIMLERNATKMRKVVPVWIDVFPLDGVPLNDEEIVRWTKKAKIYAKVFNASQYSYLAADENHFHTKKKSFFNNLFYNCRFDRLINTKLAWKNWIK